MPIGASRTAKKSRPKNRVWVSFAGTTQDWFRQYQQSNKVRQLSPFNRKPTLETADIRERLEKRPDWKASRPSNLTINENDLRLMRIKRREGREKPVAHSHFLERSREEGMGDEQFVESPNAAAVLCHDDQALTNEKTAINLLIFDVPVVLS